MPRVYLVDVNIWSEAVKPAPDRAVLKWLATCGDKLTMNAIVLGEIQAGVWKLDEGAKKRRLEKWVKELCDIVPCLGWDKSTALIWGELVGKAQRCGPLLSIKDSMIAASALRHGLQIATRNTRDFSKIPGLVTINAFDFQG